MKHAEARRQGYSYCGPIYNKYSACDSIDFWKRDVKIAKSIKRDYEGADYVIVYGSSNCWLSSNSKAIYGNETFNKLWQDIVFCSAERKLELVNKDRETAKEIYEAGLRDYARKEEEAKAFIAWRESIRKK